MTCLPLKGVHVVVPTISRTRAEQIASTLLVRLTELGATCVIVANNQAALRAVLSEHLEVITERTNPGFAASVNFGAACRSDWSVLCIFNDDLKIGGAARELLTARLIELVESASEPILASFDPEQPRRIPGPCGVFLNVSLLEAAFRRVRPRIKPSGREGTVMNVAGDKYHSFSAVGFTRRLWETLGPLDERFVFCYEDAAYSARANALPSVRVVHSDCGLIHEHSASSSRFIDFVLPATVASAREYLAALGARPTVARLIIAAALTVRLLLVPLGGADLRKHYRAIRASFRQAGSIPKAASLPPFDLCL